MSKQEIASLAVKILSLYIVVNAFVTTSLEMIPYLEQQFYAATQGVGPDFNLGSIPSMFGRELLSVLLPLLVALILWKVSNWLGKHMVHDVKEQSKQSVSSVELQTIIISVIGLFVAINAIPQFILFFLALSVPSVAGLNFSAILLQLVNPLLSVLLGWILLANAARISRSIQKERGKL